MNRLPLPNWNGPPNVNVLGVFPPMNAGYAGLPFAPHSYQQHPASYITGHQNMFMPRHPLHRDYRNTGFESSQGNGGYNYHQQTTQHKEFSCDVCEKVFKSRQILDSHLKSHVECDFEGCSFTASRKMLKLHFIQNHAKGRMRIKLETPEEIQKWREQRRKNYPTVASKEKKIAEEKARHESGQIAETQTFRYRGKKRQRNWNRQNQNSRYQKQNKKHGIDESKANEIQYTQKKVESTEAKELTGDPLSVLLNNTSQNESDGDEDVPKKTTNKPQQVSAAVASPLSALATLCSYGGDSSSDENDVENEVNNNQQDTKPVQEITPPEVPCVKEENYHVQHKRTPRKRKRDLKKNKCAPTKTRVTLLEKLLAPEIRHERNVILQCIRHIVKNNFFDAD